MITVPAYFSDTQRQATREAGEIAGLEVVRIINEPTAAALVYEAGQHEGKRILVYDLGGGTFDVSVVRIEEGVVEVISSHGNNHLGGDDFDQKIVAHILEHLKIKQGVDVSDQPRAMARILRAAEAAKRHLSDHPYARIEEEYLTGADARPVHLSLELARDEYEQMIAPFVEETLQAIHNALQAADLTASQVEEILLVGGATRTPMIRRRLLEVFASEPRGEVDADLCVAMGAAIQGAAIAGAEVSAVLVDVTPYTFGTSALGELDGELYPYHYVPIIARNTPIPVRKSEAFYTVVDDQPVVDVRIFQGENDGCAREHQDRRVPHRGAEQGAGGQSGGARSGARPRWDSARRGAREEHRPGAAHQHRPGGGALWSGGTPAGQGADRIVVRAGRRRTRRLTGTRGLRTMRRWRRCWTRPAQSWMRPRTRIARR